MALDFPNSPTIGDEFTGGGFTWVWTGDSWDKVMASTTGGNGFSLLVGASGNTTYAFDTLQPAGAYSITSQLGDTTFDIYLVTADNQNAGYTSTTALEATAEFDRIVVYSATTNDILNFDYKPSSAPATSGDVVDGAAPFLTSATPVALANIDDTTTVTGGNFATDVQIVFIGQDDVARPAKSIVRSSSTSLIVTRPDDFPPEQAPFTMRATNAGITNPSTGVNELSDYFLAFAPFNVEYLVVAGGGGGGISTYAGGGGAGGYRSSVSGELSGGGASAETPITITSAANVTVTVGAGGATAVNGSNSVFDSIISTGGGSGGIYDGTWQSLYPSNPTLGRPGGSGGGGSSNSGVGGAGTAGQGYGGGNGDGSNGGGGGGAAAAGSRPGGGAGRASSITGTSVTRAAGGAGTNSNGTGIAGAANTGNGGKAGFGASGGSGVVILRYPSDYTISSSGLTLSTATVGANKVTTVTAGTGNVSWS